MSARYSNSPALRLTVTNSRQRRILHLLLCLASACALYRLYLRGYPLYTTLLLPLAAGCCWRLAREPAAGTTLCWRQGQWSLHQGDAGEQRVVLRRCTCLPWLIYSSWQAAPGGRYRSLWLFADSAPAEQLRQLRVRLLLER